MKRHTPYTGLVVRSVLLVAVVGLARGDDWPRWRGPLGNGISQESKWKPAALSAGPKIAWRAQVGDGYSSMTVSGNRLYTMGSAGREDRVFCLDAGTGAEVWKYAYSCKKGQPRATPVIDEGLVYTVSQMGLLLCLDAKSGELKWQCDIVKEYRAKPPGWGHSGSVLISGNLLLLNAGPSGLALDKRTGKEVWSSGAGTGAHATPVPYKMGDKLAVLIFGTDKLFGVQVSDGKVLWSFPWKTSWNVNAPDPLPFDGKVFITSGYGRGGALLDISGSEPKKVWENKTIASHFGSCVLVDGYIYGVSGNTGKPGELKCLDPKTGVATWSTATGFGSLIVVGDKLIVLRDGGQVIIAEVNSKEYKELARAKVLSKQCWTAPIFSNGRIYCRNTPGEVVCVDVRGE